MEDNSLEHELLALANADCIELLRTLIELCWIVLERFVTCVGEWASQRGWGEYS